MLRLRAPRPREAVERARRASGSAALHFEAHIDVAASRMRIGADLLVGFVDELLEFGLRQRGIVDRILTVMPKPPASRGPRPTAQVTSRSWRSSSCWWRRNRARRQSRRHSRPRTDARASSCSGRSGPPISFGTDRSTLTVLSVVSLWPLRPPWLTAVAVTSDFDGRNHLRTPSGRGKRPTSRRPAFRREPRL